MAFAKPNTNLSPLLNQWKSLLQQWAKGGSLAIAAQEALLLSGISEGLQILIDEWAAADFKSLPEVELLSAADINGALGAYAISTGKIYLNETWVDSASKEDVFAVLTEELGHHLDALLNANDTSGDEGLKFARLLLRNEISAERLTASDDAILLKIGSGVIAEAALNDGTVIKDPSGYSNTWKGTTGDDILLYGGGSDTIDGLQGSDTLSIDFKKADAVIRQTSAGVNYLQVSGSKSVLLKSRK